MPKFIRYLLVISLSFVSLAYALTNLYQIELSNFINPDNIDHYCWEMPSKHICSLDSFAAYYYQKGRYKRALKLFERALAAHEKERGLTDKITLISANNLGLLYKEMGQYQQAEALFKRVIADYEQQLAQSKPVPSALSVDISFTFDNMGILYGEMGKYDDAESFYQRALLLREQHLGKTHPETATSLNNLASLYSDQQQYTKALALFQRALAIQVEKFGTDHLDTANTYSNMAGVYYKMGDYHRAKPLFEHVLTLREKQLVAGHPDILVSLHNLAFINKEMGNYSQVEPLYLRVLTLSEQKLGKDHPEVANSLDSLAEFYRHMGLYHKAEPLYQRALAIYEKKLGEDHTDTAKSANNLAMLYLNTGAYKKAEPLFLRAITIHEKVLGVDDLTVATNLANLANLYGAIEKDDKVEPLLQRSFAIRQKKLGKDNATTAISMNSLALFHYHKNDYKKAIPLFRHTLRIFLKQLGSAHPTTATILTNIGGTYEKISQTDTSNHLAAMDIFFRKQGINTLQISRKNNTTLSKELKNSFISGKENDYRYLVNRLLAQQRLQEAEHVMAMYKEKEVADYYQKTTSSHSLNKTNRPTTFIGFNAQEKVWHQRYKTIADSLYSNSKKYQALQLIAEKERSKKEQQQLHDLQQAMTKDEAEFERFFDDMVNNWSNNSATETSALSAQTANTDALQQTLARLGNQSVIVNYFVTNDKVHILLTTATTRLLRESVISVSQLRQLIQQYRTQLQQKGMLRELSKKLHQLLIDPIAADLQRSGAKTLMFSLDDALRYLPIAALHNGESYLVERYQLSVYSAAVGYEALLANAVKKPKIIAIGVTEATTVPATIAGEKPYQFNALPNVYNEITGIVKQKNDNGETGILSGDSYLDHNAKKEVLIDALSKPRRTPYSIVHLATHFQLNQGNGYQSFLLLGQQNILPIAELYSHPKVDFSHVDLLTMSACNTGMISEQSDGAEVESFATIAQQKGAKAVLASLWAVNDRSTSELMQDFYRTWQQDKQFSKAAALQQAQQRFIQQGKQAAKANCPAIQLPNMPACADRIDYPEQSHPYYWAAFSLIGNGL